MSLQESLPLCMPSDEFLRIGWSRRCSENAFWRPDRARLACLRLPSRPLLSVYSRYGLPARQPPRAALYTEGFSRFVTSTTAPIATGWSDSCRAGLTPTGRPCLGTAHRINHLHVNLEISSFAFGTAS